MTADQENDVEVCVVGAGPHGLSVVTHLVAAKPSLRDRIAVVDPSGTWLHTWREQFARLEIDVLRSPSVHHPAVDPGALGRYVRQHNLMRSALPYDPPLTSTFDAFCTDVIDELQLGGLVRTAGVDRVECGRTNRIHTSDGIVRARHLVWAGNPAVRVGTDRITTDATEPADTPSETGPAAAQHGSSVDLRTIESLAGEHVVIVGGGLSAGHLAVGALKRSADVTLVTRRPIDERNFDIEPGWMGPRCLDGYERIRSPRRRLEAAHAARGGGTMPGWMRRKLDAEIEAGRLTHRIGEFVGAATTSSGVRVAVDDGAVVADRCWLATGTKADVRAAAALAPCVDRWVDGTPVVDEDLRVSENGPFVAGGLATIEIGPGARNLWGARRAARRITRAITGLDLDVDAYTAIEPPTSDDDAVAH